jgi:quinol monooxygenase YgiN
MSDEQTPLVADLNALIASVGFPLRRETMEQAWNLTVDSQVSAEFRERVRRAIDHAVPAGELLLLVTLRARPGREPELAEAAQEFVDATRQLPGALGSTLYRSAADPLTFTLAERFTGRAALDRHMAADYFRRFQLAQGPLLERPVEAVFYQRVRG